MEWIYEFVTENIYVIITFIVALTSIVYSFVSYVRFKKTSVLDKKIDEMIFLNSKMYEENMSNSPWEQYRHYRSAANYNFYEDDIYKSIKKINKSQEYLRDSIEKINIQLMSNVPSSEISNNDRSNINVMSLLEEISNISNIDFLLSLLNSDNNQKYNVTRNVVSDIAHTLRTPMSGIHAIMLILSKTYTEDEVLNDYFSQIDKCLDQIEENIQAYQNLMIYGDISSENGDSGFVEKLASRLKIAAIMCDKRIFIDNKSIDDIDFDSNTTNLLLLAFDCIIENATVFANDNSTIKVSGKDSEEFYTFTVENEGQNIDNCNLKKIFEHGFSTRNSSGKGLFFVKKVIEDRLGGIVECENVEGPFVGVRFTIVIDKKQLMRNEE